MKGPIALGTVLVNSSTNQKPRHLSVLHYEKLTLDTAMCEMGEMDIECSWPHIENLEHRNLEIRKHVTTSLFRYETFYYFWLKSFDIRRETQSFYAGFFIWPLSRAAPMARKFVSPLRAPKVEPPCSASSFISLTFFRNPQNPPRASGAWRHPHFVTRFIISGYCDTSVWHIRSVRAHTLPPASRLHLTNPCAEPKGSQPH